MKKSLRLFCIILSLLILGACTQNKKTNNGVYSDESTDNVNITDNNQSFDNTNNSKNNTEKFELNFSTCAQFKDSFINNVFPVSNTEFFVLHSNSGKSMISLYNATENSVTKTGVVTDSDKDVVSAILKGEDIFITVRKMTFSDIQPGTDVVDIQQITSMLTVYNKNLEKVYELNLNKISTSGFVNFDANIYSKKIVYQTAKDNQYVLCVNNLTLDNPKYIYYNGKVDLIRSMSFISDDVIAFVGEKDTKDVFGVIEISSGTITVNRHDDLSDTIQIFNNITLFCDKNTEPGKNSSGVVYVLNNQSFSVNKISLTDLNESQSTYLSDDGQYIITYLVGKQKNGNVVYRYRVYETVTGKKVNEFDYNTDVPIEKADIQNILGMSDSNILIVIYNLNNITHMKQYNLK